MEPSVSLFLSLSIPFVAISPKWKDLKTSVGGNISHHTYSTIFGRKSKVELTRSQNSQTRDGTSEITCGGVYITDSVLVDLGVRSSCSIGNNELVITRNL